MNMTVKKLYNVTQQDGSISAYVILGNSGKYHAIYRDNDADMTLSVIICPTLEVAIKKCDGFLKA